MLLVAVEIHNPRQLDRINPGVYAQTAARVTEIMETAGARTVGGQRAVLRYLFVTGPSREIAHVVGRLVEVRAYLQSNAERLFGWSAIVDYAAGDPQQDEVVRAELFSRAGQILSRLPYEEQVWISDEAWEMVGALVPAQTVDAAGVILHRVADEVTTPADEIDGASDENIDRILDLFTIDAAEGRRVLVYAGDAAYATQTCIEALDSLYGQAKPFALCAVPLRLPFGVGPLVSAVTADESTIDYLCASERAVWDERVALLDWLRNSRSAISQPSNPETDLSMLLELYIEAYSRRCAEAAVPAVLLLEEITSYDEGERSRVGNVLGRAVAYGEARALTILATAGDSAIPVELRSIFDERIRLRAGGRSRRRHEENELELELALSLLITAESGHVLGLDLLVKCLQECVDGVRDGARVVDRLLALGLIRDRLTLRATDPELTAQIASEQGGQTRAVRTAVALFVYEQIAQGQLRASRPVIDLLVELGDTADLPRLFHTQIAHEMVAGRYEQVRRALYNEVPQGGFRLAERRCLDQIMYCNRIALATAVGDRREADRNESMLAAAQERSEGSCQWLAGDAYLARSRHHLATGERSGSFDLLKRALIAYQDADDAVGQARANIDFGLHLLANQDMLGAREYFGLGAKSAAAVGDAQQRFRALLCETVVLFVVGNYTRVLENAVQLGDGASRAGLRHWQLYAQFLAGRAEFELGRYEQAGACFSLGRSRARVYQIAAADELLQRWLARSMIFNGRPHLAASILERLPPSREGQFFLGEAHQLLGENLVALEELSRALELPSSTDLRAVGICWDTGFAMIEDRVIRDLPVLEHQILAFRAYVLANGGDLEGGVRELYRLTKELQTSDLDPYNRYYYFLYGSILPENGPLALEDHTTILGRAVRFIQDRTSKIDAYSDKSDFMRMSYWNAKLMARASGLNLV